MVINLSLFNIIDLRDQIGSDQIRSDERGERSI